MTFNEYFHEVTGLMDAMPLLNARIGEFSESDRYKEDVGKLRCFAGIDTHVAMVMLAEIGDFCRFGSAVSFSSYLGLCPGEQSSGRSMQKTGITKAGNSHCRKLLCESADSIARSNQVQEATGKTERSGCRVIFYADGERQG